MQFASIMKLPRLFATIVAVLVMFTLKMLPIFVVTFVQLFTICNLYRVVWPSGYDWSARGTLYIIMLLIGERDD